MAAETLKVWPPAVGRLPRASATALDLVGLSPLMRLTAGRADLSLGLIDGPIARDHPDLANSNIRELPGQVDAACNDRSSAACVHATFIAGVLVARRGSPAPAICPDCTLVVRPILPETSGATGQPPTASPEKLANALLECIAAGARVINLSVAVLQPSRLGLRRLTDALEYAARRGVIVVAATGNQGGVGGAVLPALPWVIPVAACDRFGRPLGISNLGSAIGKRGLSAPGEGIAGLNAAGGTRSFSGTSVAAPFVAGAAALLWSVSPRASAAEVMAALVRVGAARRTQIIPPLLNAWTAYQTLIDSRRRAQ
jgi:subtilisin family serine protease